MLGKMEMVLDAQRGRSVGSHIILHGRVFGVRLFLDEVVIVHEPPRAEVRGCSSTGGVLAPTGRQARFAFHEKRRMQRHSFVVRPPRSGAAHSDRPEQE